MLHSEFLLKPFVLNEFGLNVFKLSFSVSVVLLLCAFVFRETINILCWLCLRVYMLLQRLCSKSNEEMNDLRNQLTVRLVTYLKAVRSFGKQWNLNSLKEQFSLLSQKQKWFIVLHLPCIWRKQEMRSFGSTQQPFVLRNSSVSWARRILSTCKNLSTLRKYQYYLQNKYIITLLYCKI